MGHRELNSHAHAAANAAVAPATNGPLSRRCRKMSPTITTSCSQQANTSPYVLNA